MNVIFLDFDGVISTSQKNKYRDFRKRIKVLADICHKYDCKVVITAGVKKSINEDTLETKVKWVQKIFQLFKEYNIECIGRTPVIEIDLDKSHYYDMCKEKEIMEYLYMHPEVTHFCIIDDYALDEMPDSGMLKEYVVQPLYYAENPEDEGLLPKHSDEVGMILRKSNGFIK